ncbi:nitrate- and nitrite sensing domain-containing protein [Micromonospora sp. SL1-18]|uniref:nitrate- and nitrite sensing domain-containing protein n=1 Tax=Micromonospora sp. SL1-18 TaxID=3399128 RepID=UPI003A4E57B8
MSTGSAALPESPDADKRKRRRLPQLRDARIRSKLALILVVPVAAVIALAGVRLVSVGQSAYEATRIRSLTALSIDVSALAQDLHKERMAAAAYLAGPNSGPDGTNDFNLRVRRTDERIAAYQDDRGQLGSVPASIRDRLKVIDDHLATLNGTRQEVLDRRQMPVAEASLRYGIVLDDLVAYGDALAQQPGAESIAGARRAVAAFAHAKAEVADEQAVAFTALAAGRIDEEQFSSFLATLTAQQEALLSFSRAAEPAQRSLVNSTVSGDAVQLADRVANDVSRSVGSRSVGQAPPVTGDDAATAIGAVNDLMRWAEIQLQEQLLSAADQARADVTRQAFVESLLVLLTLAIAVTLAVVLARSLNESLRRLREGALAVANHELPDAVSRLQNVNAVGDGGVDEIVRQVRDPIKLTNRDEVGQVAAAFNVVHREAVRVAAEQAALRTSVSAMFLNLARRSQNLVDRMIGELDAIERGEEDPKRLARLFELDHLATRMRRNDENLLVLAGADSAVPRREDALLVDVLRAAQSEVELYNRIEFGTVDTDISVASHVVNDVVRLVAELLDNATRFSPPNTTVVADGRRIRDYVLIQVEDRGLGLSEEQLDSLNRRLAAPPTVDVAAFRLMGLAVVGRLASRYGIRVELRRNVEGGTVAQVTLPNSAVVLPANRSQASLARPRQPLAVEQSPVSQGAATADPLADATRGATATLTDQWHTASPPPARWQSAADARDTGPAVQLGGTTDALPSVPIPAPVTPAASAPVSDAGWSTDGGPTATHPTLDPLPKRTPGGETSAPATPAPMAPSAYPPAPATPAPVAPPAYPPALAAPAPVAPPAYPPGPVYQSVAAVPPAPAAPVVATAPVVAQTAPPAEAPIFREMEAVWFRSHGNDETTIFARLRFDDEPAPAAARPVAAAPPPLPTRTPGAQASGLASPPPYTPPAAPSTPPAAVPPSPPTTDASAWRTAADEGWSRASRAAEPTNGGTTRSGLPKRVPQAQLVPGGIEPKGSRASTRRTPDEVRGLLSAYHRGVQRGRTAGADLNSTSTKETNR